MCSDLETLWALFVGSLYSFVLIISDIIVSYLKASRFVRLTWRETFLWLLHSLLNHVESFFWNIIWNLYVGWVHFCHVAYLAYVHCCCRVRDWVFESSALRNQSRNPNQEVNHGPECSQQHTESPLVNESTKRLPWDSGNVQTSMDKRTAETCDVEILFCPFAWLHCFFLSTQFKPECLSL